MKKLIVLIFTLFIMLALCACGADKAGEKVEYYKLNECIYYDTGDVNFHENTYDEQWNLLSQQLFVNGEKTSDVEYIYSDDYTMVTVNYWSKLYEPEQMMILRDLDDKGRPVKAENYENGELSSTEEYIYDEQGHVVKTLVNYSNGVNLSTEHAYDKNGNLLSTIHETSAYRSEIRNTYDEKGYLISTENYQNDRITSRVDYEQDGNSRHGVSSDGYGTFLSEIYQELDEAGNVIELRVYDPYGNLQRETYTMYAGSDGSISGQIPD